MSNHSFDIEIAAEYKSIEIATLVWHFQYWIIKNKRLNRNFIEGRTWTYQTLEEITAVFPYWSFDQVKRLIAKAIQLNILIKGNFNKSRFDRTVWYAFKHEEKFGIWRIRQMEFSESLNGNSEIATPIPDTLPDTLTYKEKREGDKLPTFALPSKIEKTKIEKAKFVSVSSEEHETLIAKYGVEKTEAAYEKLSLWKEDTPKSKWKKNDYRSICRWVMEAVCEDEIKKKKKKSVEINDNEIEKTESNKQWFDNILNKIKKPSKDEIIRRQVEYIQFLNYQGDESKLIYFKDEKFKELIRQELTKRKYREKK